MDWDSQRHRGPVCCDWGPQWHGEGTIHTDWDSGGSVGRAVGELVPSRPLPSRPRLQGPTLLMIEAGSGWAGR